MNQDTYSAKCSFHLRGVDAVRSKLLRAYPTLKAACSMPGAIENALNQQMDNAWQSDQWRDTKRVAIEQSSLDAGSSAAIDAAAMDIAQRYAKAFFLQRHLTDIADNDIPDRYGNFYRWQHARGHLVEVMVNHISNYAEARFSALGLTPKSAHALHGLVIGSTIRAYKAALKACDLEDYAECTVNPGQGSIKHKTDDRVAEEIAELNQYWRVRKHELERGYEQFTAQR